MSTSSPAPRLRHAPHLDGLRAVAVGLVMVQHFAPKKAFVGSEGVFPLGTPGVDLFFVLSGFLITFILLQQRDSAVPLADRWRTFFARRVLRLFPLYYGVLLLAVAFNYEDIRSFWPWMFGYAGNFYFGITDSRSVLLPFWSLAVEEQFYLLWPAVIWLLPRRLLLPALAATVAVGPLSRLVLTLADSSILLVRYATTSCFDLLGTGALLALAMRQGWDVARGLRRLMAGAGVLFAGLVVAYAAGVASLSVALIAFSTCMAPLYAWLVYRGYQGYENRVGAAILSSRPVMYVGQISYGVYVLQNPVEDLVTRLGGDLWFLQDDAALVRFVVLSALTIGAASVTWYAVERPFLRLKDRVPYASGAPPSESGRTLLRLPRESPMER